MKEWHFEFLGYLVTIITLFIFLQLSLGAMDTQDRKIIEMIKESK